MGIGNYENQVLEHVQEITTNDFILSPWSYLVLTPELTTLKTTILRDKT